MNSRRPFGGVAIWDFSLRDFNAEFGFDFRVRLMRSHQAQAFRAHARMMSLGLFASFIFDLPQADARPGRVSWISERLNKGRIHHGRERSPSDKVTRSQGFRPDPRCDLFASRRGNEMQL